MNQAAEISAWKQLVDSLVVEVEGRDNTRPKITIDILNQLAKVFQHLPSQPIPRLQKDYNTCLTKSDKILENLFDNIDLSDKPLLCAAIELCTAYGHFQLAQITYRIGSNQFREQLTVDLQDPHAYPIIVKTKWYNMHPLLPEAGTLGWKAILNHGLVREEPRLMHSCLRLLTHKLHFYSVIRLMEKFQIYSEVIRKNGEKVAEKLLELIRDVAYEDERIIGIDSFIYNLLVPFLDEEKQAAILDAIIQDLFKPYFFEVHDCKSDVDELYAVVDNCIMSKPKHQEIFVHKIVDHLKCNIIRRKRRHSMDTTQEGVIKLEDIISKILSGTKPVEFVVDVANVEVSNKSLQTKYLPYWCSTVSRIIAYKTLTSQSCMIIFGVCCTLLSSLSEKLDEDLLRSVSILAAKAIENAGPNKIEKVLRQYDDLFMIEFTKLISATSILTETSSPVRQVYTSYLQRQLMFCLLRGNQAEMDRLSSYITFICSSQDINKAVAQQLQYVSVSEFARFSSKNRGSKKFQEVRLQCSRACSEKLYKFIKKNSTWRERSEEDMVDEETSSLNGSFSDNHSYAMAIDALVCVLRVSISCEDKDILDKYSDLMLRLYHLAKSRLEKIVGACKRGIHSGNHPIDAHLPKLTALYAEHRELIGGYLNYDLMKVIALLLMENESDDDPDELSKAKLEKKNNYNQLKTNLTNLEERAKAFPGVYQTIINKQYMYLAEQGPAGHSSGQEIKKEKPCCHKYRQQMEIIGDVAAIVLNKCQFDIYKQVMERTLDSLNNCDALNHSKVMYIFLVLENLVPRSSTKIEDNSPILLLFKESMPKISCNLIRISKTVELGPSIHAFVKAGSHKTNRAIQCCTYSCCIKLYTQIFMRFPPKLTNHLLTDAMQISISANLIQYARYSTRLYKFFIQLASSIASLLKAICIGKKEDELLKSAMPIFMSVLSLLIRCIILASDRQKREQPLNRSMMDKKGRPKQNGTSGAQENGLDSSTNDESEKFEVLHEYESQLRYLVIDVCRIMNSLSFLRVKMVDYAPHLISTYIKDIQLAACPDELRLQLNEGVFRIFNLVDAYQQERQDNIIESGIQRKTTAARASGSMFEMIHARLDQASREIFREMHETYNKFHRYVGKC